MHQDNDQEIYFHVGTGKTGTTFLQYRVFPKFRGIYYIQRTRFPRAEKIIRRTDHQKYLLSREFDQQLERRAREFAAIFPDTRPIIVFRRHDSYIASQYRRFVKNGYRGSFREFFDLENDQGLFKKEHLDYYSQIRLLEGIFTRHPIVLFYEDLREDPAGFIQDLAARIGATVDMAKVNLKTKHASYTERQLKAIQALGKYVDLRKRRIFKNEALHFLSRLYLGGIRYTTLHAARVLPISFGDEQPLIAPAELRQVRAFYEVDWQRCAEYARDR